MKFKELLTVLREQVLKRILSVVAKERKRRGGDVKKGEEAAAASFKSMGGDKVMVRERADSMGEVNEEEGGAGAVGQRANALDRMFDGEEDEVEEEGDSDDEKGRELDRGYDEDDGAVSSADEGEEGVVASSNPASKKVQGKENADDGSDSEEESRVGGSQYAVPSSPSLPVASLAKAKTTMTRVPRSKQAIEDALSDNSTLRHNEKDGWAELQLRFPATERRLLMVQLAEEAAKFVTVRSTKDISNAYGIETDGGRVAVQTEGVNFEAAWGLGDLIDATGIKSNDIYRILLTYGVEAARSSIVSEINGVFNVYGINVNARHLSLIADFMTRSGRYVPMNRNGMNDCVSPFLQMSFETTCTFLTKAAQEGISDNMESPSARIVLGKVPKLGTGAFDLLVPIEK